MAYKEPGHHLYLLERRDCIFDWQPRHPNTSITYHIDERTTTAQDGYQPPSLAIKPLNNGFSIPKISSRAVRASAIADAKSLSTPLTYGKLAVRSLKCLMTNYLTSGDRPEGPRVLNIPLIRALSPPELFCRLWITGKDILPSSRFS